MAAKRRRRLPRVEERQRATRRQLVKAARRLFGGHGVFEVSIEDLAHEAGVGKGTVYLYFANRDALLGAALEDCLEEIEEWIAGELAGPSGMPDRARRVARAYLEFLRRHPDITGLLLQVRGLILLQPARHRTLARPIQRHLSLLEERLVDGSRTSRPAAHPLAVLILGTALGVASTSMMGRPRRGWMKELECGLADCAQTMAQRTLGKARSEPDA